MVKPVQVVNDCRRRLPRTFPKTTPDLCSSSRTMAPLSTRTRTRVVVARRSGGESARVCTESLRQILDGDLAAGTHLSQQAVALAEGTSNGPGPSAPCGGWPSMASSFTSQAGAGYRVCDWSEARLDDLLAVRRALETEAARLAAHRAGRRRSRRSLADRRPNGTTHQKQAVA